MSFVARRRPAWLLFLLVLACDGGPSGPSAGSLRVTILGLPNGTAAAVTVTGPDNFNQPVSATQTFTQVTPGVYTISATAVAAGNSTYDPSPLRARGALRLLPDHAAERAAEYNLPREAWLVAYCA